MYVLDSSALLALLLGEAGADEVRLHWLCAVMSAITLGESLTKSLRLGVDLSVALPELKLTRIPVVPWTEELVWQGRDLCPLAWTHGLSLADRACLTTARALGRIALTADRAWSDAVRGLSPSIRVQLIRPR